MMQQDSMKEYMKDIAKIPLINVQEEIELAAKIKAGSEEAKEKLVSANLRLVVKIAHDFKGIGLPLQDLVAEGNIGLIRAAEKFDPSKGAKFSSYASWWIKQAMRRAISEKSKTIRIPVASVTKIMKIRNMKSILTQKLGREPSDEEISKEVDLSKKVVRRLRQADMGTVSLNDPILLGEEGEISHLIADHTAISPYKILDYNESTERLNIMLSKLNLREQDIIKMRYGLDGKPPQTLEEISKKIGRTRERVRQIQKRALKKLRVQLS